MVGLENLGKNLDGGLEFLGDHAVGSRFVERVEAGDVSRPDDDLSLGAQPPDEEQASAGGGRIGDGEDDDFRPADAGQPEDLRPADIPEKGFFAVLDGLADKLRIEIDDKMLDPGGSEDAGQVLPVQSVPDDDDMAVHPGRRRFLFLRRAVGLPQRFAGRPGAQGVGRPQEIRRDDHGQDRRGQEQLKSRAGEEAVGPGGSGQDEGEFPDLGHSQGSEKDAPRGQLQDFKDDRID